MPVTADPDIRAGFCLAGQPACTIRQWAVICPRHMAPSSVHSSRWFPTLLWSNSIALSWMWGLFFYLPAEIAAAFVNYA